MEGVLEFESVPNPQKEIFSEKVLSDIGKSNAITVNPVNKDELKRENERLRKELNQLKVKEVERQQTLFGVGIND